MHVLELTDKKVGRLTVIGRAGSSARHESVWLCRCDCGEEKKVAGKFLTRLIVKSCGCLKRETYGQNNKNLSRTGSRPWLPREQVVKTRFMARYKNDAKRRGLAWAVTASKFVSLMNSPCHYCGGLPVCRRLKHRKDYDLLICNGVDRVNNLLGYFPDNVVACCKMCQRAKLDLPLQEFLNYLDRVSSYRQTTNS